jgi:serine protease AprX
MKRVAISFVGLWSVWILAATTASGQAPKVAADLQNPEKTAVQVIVQFDKDPTEAYHQKILSRGGTLKAALHSVKSATYWLPASAVAELANDPSVVHISQDHKIVAKLDYTASAVNAPAAWQSGWTGTGIGVALLDSGMSPDQDITERNVIYQQNLIQGEASGSVYDRYGHGMHVAGIIASNGASSSCANCTRTLKGMAPGANLINLRVLDENGESTDSTVIAGIETAIQLKEKYNIRVMNLSLGRPVFESYKVDPLCQAVEAAWRAGIVVVVAAGNEGRGNAAGNGGYGTITAPGNDPYVITVGAMKTMGTYERSDDLIASYSSKGPTLIDEVVKPDIVAPGNRVVSLLAPGDPALERETGSQGQVPYSYYESSAERGVSNRYLVLSGTSMAAGVVSGAVADLLQAQPSLTPDQVKALLMQTAYKVFPKSSVATDPVTGVSYTSYYDVFTRGAGYLDLAAALQNKEPLGMGSALSPTVRYSNLTEKPYLIFERGSMWNRLEQADVAWTPGRTWGTAGVEADRSLWSESGLWAERTIWSASKPKGERTLWGESMTDETASASDSNVIVTGEP